MDARPDVEPAPSSAPDALALTDEQAAAAYAPDGPLLVLAGPGSGKTRTVVARMLHLIRDRALPPASVLALAFGARAADELRGRLSRRLGNGRTPDVTTIHAFGLRIVRRWPERCGYRGPVRVCSPDERRALGAAVAHEHGMPSLDPAALVGVLDHYRLGLLPPDGTLAALASAFEARLLREGRIDYTSMLLLPLRLLEEDARVARLLPLVYRCVLVDEAQDLSLVQYRLVRALGAEHRNVTLVGDSHQQLYAWRGADGETLRRFVDEFPQARTVGLRQNFRSVGAIVALANALGRPFPDARDLWTANESGPAPVVEVAADERAEAVCVAKRTRRLLDTGAVARPADVAVLARTRAQTPVLAAALAEQGIATTDARSGSVAPPGSSNRVRLLTVHAAKGGEWSVVFLTGLEEGLLPHRRTIEERGSAGADEERRVAYVAVTRPQRRLILTCCRARRFAEPTVTPHRVRGDTSTSTPRVARQPSRFLLEVLDAGLDIALVA